MTFHCATFYLLNAQTLNLVKILNSLWILRAARINYLLSLIIIVNVIKLIINNIAKFSTSNVYTCIKYILVKRSDWN